MGNRFIIKRENFLPTAGQDALTIISASGRRLRLVDLSIGGLGSTSAAQQFAVHRSTAGTTPGGAIAPSEYSHSEQAAAAFTTATTWAAQPSLETNGMTVGWNAVGGAWSRGFNPGILEARNGECISIRALAAGVTYQNCSLSAVVEED